MLNRCHCCNPQINLKQLHEDTAIKGPSYPSRSFPTLGNLTLLQFHNNTTFSCITFLPVLTRHHPHLHKFPSISDQQRQQCCLGLPRHSSKLNSRHLPLISLRTPEPPSISSPCAPDSLSSPTLSILPNTNPQNHTMSNPSHHLRPSVT
jgi:hypothetical protein